MRVVARLLVVAVVGALVRGAWGRWAQGPHRSTVGAPVAYPSAPPRRADTPAPLMDDYRRGQA